MNIAKALNNLRPASDWSIRGEVINWLDKEQTEPTQAEIEAEVSRIESEYDANQYQRDRAVSFPTWQEQMDMQYHDEIDGTTTWVDAVAKVKADNPK